MGAADFRSIPQHSRESEQTVLGGLLLVNEAWDRVCDLIVEGDFYLQQHRLVFGAISALINANKPADVITVFEHLEANGKAGEAGGLPYLNELSQSTPNAANIRRYAEIVRERSILRKLDEAGRGIQALAFDASGMPARERLAAAETKVLAIADSSAGRESAPREINGIIQQFLDMVQERTDNPGDVIGTSTGFVDLDRMTAGLQAGDLVILAARPSMGKAQPLESKVLGKNGSWIRMGDIRLGDSLASVDGTDSIVTGVFPQGALETYRVTFSDGRATECCGDHLWRVMYRDWERPRVLSTKRLIDMLACARYRGRLWVESASGHFGHNLNLPLDPWVMGALLGDGGIGTSNAIIFSTACEQTLQRMKERAGVEMSVTHKGGYDYRIVQAAGSHRTGVSGVTKNPISEVMKELGLWGLRSHEKFIPDVFMSASRDARLDILRGLLDTDGWVEKWGSIRFSTASARLAQDVASLVRSVGGWCSISEKKPVFTDSNGEKKQGLTAWVCNISHHDPKSLFLMSSKVGRAMIQMKRQKRPTISSIDPVRTTECQCISVSHPQRTYVTDDYIVTHNTTLALNIAEHVAIKERLPVAVFSMEMGSLQLVTLLVASLGRIDSQHIRNGHLTDEEFPRLIEAVERLRGIPLEINEQPGLTASEIRSDCRRLKRKHGGKLGLIVVDYLQLMGISAGMSEENRATAVGEISRGLKLLAKEMGCPVLALSQLSRAVESRTDKRPMMSDLRESGAIEQDADVIMFLYRADYYEKESCKEPGVAECIISKQRTGPTGTVKLVFLKEMRRFESLASHSFD